jgi:hypothetical protein
LKLGFVRKEEAQTYAVHQNQKEQSTLKEKELEVVNMELGVENAKQMVEAKNAEVNYFDPNLLYK